MKGLEVRKADKIRTESGFYTKYMQGKGLDIGYRGLNNYDPNPLPVLPNAVGVDLDYPGYNGITLPFANNSQDFVFASHVLEHIKDYKNAIKEWHRVVKVGGYLIIIIPNKFLYDRKKTFPPPAWACPDHKRIYSPASLLQEIEESLLPNSYRIETMKDSDDKYDYSITPDKPIDFMNARFETEIVLRKIQTPKWTLLE